MGLSDGIGSTDNRAESLSLELAQELADWAFPRMVNRTDVYGQYWHPHVRRRFNGKARTVHKPLTNDTLVNHFRGESPGQLIGLHTTSLGNTCLFVAVDIDQHGNNQSLADANRRTAVHLYETLCSLGFAPLLLDSDGNGSFHLMVMMSEPIASVDAYKFAQWLVKDWSSHGIQQPETFPKQPDLKKGQFGNFLRPPGRHHTRNHWSRAWDGRKWLVWPATAELILSHRGDSPRLLTDEMLSPLLPISPPPPSLSSPEESCVPQDSQKAGGQGNTTATRKQLPENDATPEITGATLALIEDAIGATTPTGPGQRKKKLFEFGRHLAAIPDLSSVPAHYLKEFVQQWWRCAVPFVRDKEWEETWVEFVNFWDRGKIRVPVGAPALAEIVARAISESRTDSKQELLTRVCQLAQETRGNQPFPLAVRPLGKELGWGRTTVSRYLQVLMSEGVIERVYPGHQGCNGGKGRAAEYRFQTDAGEQM